MNSSIGKNENVIFFLVLLCNNIVTSEITMPVNGIQDFKKP